MEIIHQDKNRIVIGEHANGWITVIIASSNGHVGKLVMPEALASVTAEWLENEFEINTIGKEVKQ